MFIELTGEHNEKIAFRIDKIEYVKAMSGKAGCRAVVVMRNGHEKMVKETYTRIMTILGRIHE